MQILVIGEGVHSLNEEFKDAHHTTAWHQIVALRNQTAHGYVDIKPEIIWQTIQEDLRQLKKFVEEVLEA